MRALLFALLFFAAPALAQPPPGQPAYPDVNVWLTTEDRNLRTGLDDGTIFATGSEGVLSLGSGTCPANVGQVCWAPDSDDCVGTGGTGTLCHYDGTVWGPLGGGQVGAVGSALFGALPTADCPANAGQLCWVTDSDDCAGAGGSGALCRYDGSTWDEAVLSLRYLRTPSSTVAGLGTGECPDVDGQLCQVTDAGLNCNTPTGVATNGILCRYSAAQSTWLQQGLETGITTAALLAASPGFDTNCPEQTGRLCWVSDSDDCVAGAGSGMLCRWDGAAWEPITPTRYRGSSLIFGGFDPIECPAVAGQLCWVTDAVDEIDCSVGQGVQSHACLYNGTTWERAAHVHGETPGYAHVRPDCDVTPQTDCYDTIQAAILALETSHPSAERFILVTPNPTGVYTEDVALVALGGMTNVVGLGASYGTTVSQSNQPTLVGATGGDARTVHITGGLSSFYNMTIAAGPDAGDVAYRLSGASIVEAYVVNSNVTQNPAAGVLGPGQQIVRLNHSAGSFRSYYSRYFAVADDAVSDTSSALIYSNLNSAGSNQFLGGELQLSTSSVGNGGVAMVEVRGDTKISFSHLVYECGRDSTCFEFNNTNAGLFRDIGVYQVAPVASASAMGQFANSSGGTGANAKLFNMGTLDGATMFQVDSVWGQTIIASRAPCSNPISLHCQNPSSPINTHNYMGISTGDCETNPNRGSLWLSPARYALLTRDLYAMVDQVPLNTGVWTFQVVWDQFPFDDVFTSAISCSIDQNSPELTPGGVTGCQTNNGGVIPRLAHVVVFLQSTVTSPTNVNEAVMGVCLSEIPR